MDDYECMKESPTQIQSVFFPEGLLHYLSVSGMAASSEPILASVLVAVAKLFRYKTDRPLNDVAISPLYCHEASPYLL